MASAGRGWWSDVDGSPWGAQTTADALVRDYRSDSRSVAERGGAGCGSWAVHVRSDRRGANLRVCVVCDLWALFDVGVAMGACMAGCRVRH